MFLCVYEMRVYSIVVVICGVCCVLQRSRGKMNPEMALVVKRTEEREALRGVIAQWNANRLDLFALSEPNEVSHYRGS